MNPKFVSPLFALLFASLGGSAALVACSDAASSTDDNGSSTTTDASSQDGNSTENDATLGNDATPSDGASDSGAGILDAAACDDGNPCTKDVLVDGVCTHPLAAKGTECRPTAGACDAPEVCDGLTAACPADEFIAAGTECRLAVGACDVAEKCTGTSAACPVDGVANASTVCRASASACDLAEKCDGTTKTCGTDLMKTPVAYGATGGNAASNLYTLNATNGATLSTVGAIGYALTGLAQHPKTGVLYGVTTAQSPVANKTLVTIDMTTGAATAVGALGVIIADISFDSMGNLYGWSEDNDDLASINITTGAATVVSDSPLDTFGSGLAFDSKGTLYFAGAGVGEVLRTLNPTTGVATDLPKMTGFQMGTEGTSIRALAVHPITDVLYGVQGANGAVTYLFTVDKATSAVTPLGSSIVGLDAFAFACTP